MSWRAVAVITVVIVGFCAVAVVFIWTVQRSFVFVPNTSPVGAAAESFEGGVDLTLHTDDGVTLDAWLLPADPSTDRAAAVLYAPEQTLYLGESIVTGVVARLQSTHAPAGVLLRSPFPDFVVVAGEDYGLLPMGMLLRDRFPVIAHVEDSQVPITVLYGSADTIVPPSFSSEVAESVNNLSEEIVLEGVGAQ